MFGYIYITTNLITGKKYIGQHQSSVFEFDKYIGSGKYLFRAIKKYGKNNFKCELLESINGVKTICESKEELSDSEIYYINYYNCVESEEYYNIASGGGGGNIGINIEGTKKKSEQRFKELLDRIDINEFIDFYKTHNNNSIREKFDLTVSQFYKLVKFLNLSKTQEEVNLIIQNVIKEKYGVTNAFQSEEVKEKMKQTKLLKYGNEYYSNQEQADQTRLEKFGSKSAFGNEEIRQKSKDTLIQKYGSLENYHKEQHKLAEQTCIERYGENYMQEIVTNKGLLTKKKNKELEDTQEDKQDASEIL